VARQGRKSSSRPPGILENGTEGQGPYKKGRKAGKIDTKMGEGSYQMSMAGYSVGIVHTLSLQEQVKSKLKHPPENVENTGLLPSFRRKMIELSKLKVSWGAVHRFTERFLPRPRSEDIVICKW